MSVFEDILNEPDEGEVVDETATPDETVAVDVSEPVEASGTPEEPALGSATDDAATPAPERPALPDGYKYDAQGRVHDAQGRVVAKEKVAELVASVPTPVSTPDAVATPAAPPVVGAPFQYRAFGETKTVEGIQVLEDGTVRVSPEKASELRHLYSLQESLGQQSQYVDSLKAKVHQYEQEIAQHKAGSSAEIAKANALVETYSRMLQEPDEAKAIEAFFQLRAQFPVLLHRAEAEYWKSRASQGRPDATPQPAGQQPASSTPELPTREIALETTQDYIERFKLEHGYRDVAPDDWKQFIGRATRNPWAYTRPALPEEAQRMGVAPGSYVFDDLALKADLDDYAKQIRQARKEREAARFNVAQKPTAPNGTRPRVAVAAVSATPSKPKGWDQRINDIWREPEDDD